MSTWTNADRVSETEAAPIFEYRQALRALVWHMRELEDLRLRVLVRHETLRTRAVLVIVRNTQERVRQLQAAMRPVSDFYHDLGGCVKMDCAGFEASPDAGLMAQAKHALDFLRGRLAKWYLLEGQPDEVVDTIGRTGWRGLTEYTEGSYWEGYMQSYTRLIGATG